MYVTAFTTPKLCRDIQRFNQEAFIRKRGISGFGTQRSHRFEHAFRWRWCCNGGSTLFKLVVVQSSGMMK